MPSDAHYVLILIYCMKAVYKLLREKGKRSSRLPIIRKN